MELESRAVKNDFKFCKLFSVITASTLILLNACGGVPASLPSGALSELPVGSVIAPDDAIRITFHEALNASSVVGNVGVTQEGTPIPIRVIIDEEGFSLTVVPLTSWVAGKPLVLTLRGGERGIHFKRGVPIQTINITYFVEGK